MNELSPAAALNTPGDFKLGSAGKPIEGVRLTIDHSVAEPGARDGELIVHGPIVMKGYHGMPEATEEAFTELGFFRTRTGSSS